MFCIVTIVISIYSYAEGWPLASSSTFSMAGSPVAPIPFRELRIAPMPSPFRITPDRAVLGGMLLTAAVYCRDLQYDFILDDVPFILLNETLTAWKSWTTLFVPPIVHVQGADAMAVHYRPISLLWFMTNYHLFGMVLPWWHLTSLLLHLLAVLLVYMLAVKVLREPWTAGLTALLFAFHPIHVESVAYLSASTDLLATVFVLLAFLAYSRFREQHSRWYLLPSLLAAALALLSKETAAILPLLLVAYELLREPQPAAERWNKRLLWTTPFFGLVVAYAALRQLGNLGPGPAAGRLTALSDIPLVLLTYLRNLLWPAHLSFFYPVEWSSQWTFGKGCAAALVLVACVFLWKRYKEHSGMRLQLLWTAILFLIPLACVLAFRKEDWVHDRHMYLVSIPFCLATAVVLTDMQLPRKASILAGSLLATTLLIVTAVQLPRFKDELSVYESALQVAPRNMLLRRYYVAALWNKVLQVQQPSALRDQALREFRVNIELGPQLELDYVNYATALDRAGLDPDALTQYQKALRLDSGEPTHFRATILYRLAGVDLRLSNLEEAESSLREALAIDPNAMGYHALLAQVLSRLGRGQEAAGEMQLEAGVREEFARRHSVPSGRLHPAPAQRP
jgi:protein O-mannosyl-transferase